MIEPLLHGAGRVGLVEGIPVPVMAYLKFYIVDGVQKAVFLMRQLDTLALITNLDWILNEQDIAKLDVMPKTTGGLALSTTWIEEQLIKEPVKNKKPLRERELAILVHAFDGWPWSPSARDIANRYFEGHRNDFPQKGN